MNVRIYVEGGGDQRATLSACREGFAEFFGKIAPENHWPKIIPCGSRNSAFDDFKTAIRMHQDSFVLLLVDSEDAVAPGTGPWVHLKGRDGWEKPAGATDDHAHLMVQCTESWFLADRNVLVEYYGQGFNQVALPANPHFEQIPKEDALGGLRNATRATKTKGVYSKVRHGYQLVALLDPVSVRNASPYAERLCALVVDRLADP